MQGSNRTKIVNKLRRGYTPVEISPKKELSSTFKNIFKPLVKRKDLTFFFDLYAMGETVLKAWSFLGIYQILEEDASIREEDKAKLHSIVTDLLSEKSEITYYGGSVESRASLREHHVTRLVEINKSLILEPVLEYVNSYEGSPDTVIMELLEHVISKSSDNSMEELLLNFSRSIDLGESQKKISMVKSFDNLSRNANLHQRKEITALFKDYLENYETFDDSNLSSKERELVELIFQVGANIDLNLENETLEFVNSLQRPYDSLDVIATRYQKNKKFQSIILKKLRESENPHFIVEILKAMLVIGNELPDWKRLVMENVMKYQLTDGDLVKAMENSGIIDEEMMISFLEKGAEWSLQFLREYLIQQPHRLSEWKDLQNALIGKLKAYRASADDKVLEFILSLIIDLELKDFLRYSVDIFKWIESDKLRKMAIFPILKFGDEEILLTLKEFMKQNQESGRFVMQFLDRLERNEWRFYY